MDVPGEIRRPGDVCEPVDWWDLDYVEIGDDMICPVCQTGLVEPYSTECGHTFCRQCIETAMKHLVESNEPMRCPVDREILERSAVAAPLVVKCMVDDLVVKCPFVARGCKWQSQRWLLDSHFHNECNYVHVVCSCGNEVERRFFKNDTCCCGGNTPDRDAEVSGGEENESCEPEKDILDSHLCPGSQYGCTGSNEEAHTRNCPLALIAPTLRSQSSKMAELSAENRALRHQYEQGRRQQQQEALDLDNQLLKEYDRMWRGMAESEARSESHVKQLMMLSRENIRMTEDMALLRANVESLHRQLYHIMARNQRVAISDIPLVPPPARVSEGRPDEGDNPKEPSTNEDDDTFFRKIFQKL